MLRFEKKTNRSFSPIYLAILSGILLLILIINGFLEINRTKNGFYLFLEREASVLFQRFEKNIQETFSSLELLESTQGRPLLNPSLSGFLFSMEESIAEYFVEAAHRVDQIDGEKPLASSDFTSLTDQYLLTSIEFYDPKGNLLRSWPPSSSPKERDSWLRELINKKRSVVIDLFNKPFTKDHWFSVAIWRKASPGIVALHFNGEQMKSLFRQFSIQRAISDIDLREGVFFISVLDDHFNTIGHTDPSLIGRREEDPFLKSSLQSSQPHSRLYLSSRGEEVFEVAKSFSFKEKIMGLIRIGYSSNEIHPIIRQIKKNVTLSIFFFLILGGSAISLIWVNQNRHLRRMKEMEDRIQFAERLSSLGHLAAGVAHEIRNPLNAIGMGLQRLKREYLPQDESKREEYSSFTELILKEIRRMNEIIEQFLTLCRPFQLDLRMASLQELLDNVITLFREEASSKGISLRQEMNAELPLIKMDPERLTQAFINIMKNGIEATGPGGILSVETHSLKDQVMVTFSDSGSGIPADQMEKIFNYYYTTKENGVGLGLPIAHRIIEAHGGQLTIRSQVGVGTKVTVTLPIERKDEGGS